MRIRPPTQYAYAWLLLALLASSQQLALADPAVVSNAAAALSPSNGSAAPPTVGMQARIENLVLPGSELEVVPATDRRAPLVVRIVRTAPHGTAFRYDITWYALEPGNYDLRDRLRRKDGSSAADLPKLPIMSTSALNAKFALPHELPPRQVTGFGHYDLIYTAVIAVWLFGLGAIFLWGRRSRENVIEAAETEPRTFAEMLRPLVERGIAGTLTPTECATLERALFDHWADRLGLRDALPAELFRALHAHPEAGLLVRRLESWLHAPTADRGDARATAIEVEALLAPYLQDTHDHRGTKQRVPVSAS